MYVPNLKNERINDKSNIGSHNLEKNEKAITSMRDFTMNMNIRLQYPAPKYAIIMAITPEKSADKVITKETSPNLNSFSKIALVIFDADKNMKVIHNFCG